MEAYDIENCQAKSNPDDGAGDLFQETIETNTAVQCGGTSCIIWRCSGKSCQNKALWSQNKEFSAQETSSIDETAEHHATASNGDFKVEMTQVYDYGTSDYEYVNFLSELTSVSYTHLTLPTICSV